MEFLGIGAASTKIPCTVRAMISETYGKMPKSGADRQIIMEFEYYMSYFSEAGNTVFNKKYVDQATGESMLAWMRQQDELSYHFSNQIIANMPSPRYQSYENSNF